jgi:hypothetical protein
MTDKERLDRLLNWFAKDFFPLSASVLETLSNTKQQADGAKKTMQLSVERIRDVLNYKEKGK